MYYLRETNQPAVILLLQTSVEHPHIVESVEKRSHEECLLSKTSDNDNEKKNNKYVSYNHNTKNFALHWCLTEAVHFFLHYIT